MVPNKVAKVANALLREGLFEQIRMAVVSQIKAPDATCPLCGFHGKFRCFGEPVRTAVRCPSCGSLERHRLFALAHRQGALDFKGKDVLAFASDQATRDVIRSSGPGSYDDSSWPPTPEAKFSLDIQSIDLPDGSYDVAVASHVLEHVDDRRALSELFRILRPGGQLIFMIPIAEGWAKTYEDPTKTSERERHIHFGQFDHVRYYGADVRDRVRDAGFELAEFTASGPETIEYGLMRGEKVFIATRR